MALSKTRLPADKPQKRTGDLAEQAFERLREAILTGELKEGERVREARLAAEWKMGVTPIKAAVRRLAGMGYLVLRPNHAPIVRKLEVSDIEEIYELREMLECHALRKKAADIAKSDLTALRQMVNKVEATTSPASRLRAQFALDTKLHELWISGPTHPWLAASLEGLLIYRPNLIHVLKAHPALVERAFEDHKRILKALEKGNIENAVLLLSEHIKKSGLALVALGKPAGSRS